MFKLLFLTDDPRWVDLATRYWQFDIGAEKFPNPAQDIAHEMQTHPNMIAGVLAKYCVAYDDAAKCPKCGNPAWTFRSRSDFLNFFRRYARGSSSPIPAIVCLDCTGKELEQQRVSETQKLQDENQAKAEALRQLKGQFAKVKLEKLTLEQAVFLDAYGRIGLTENLTVLLSLKAIREMKHKLAPCEENDFQVINTLFDPGLIRLHSENSPDVITDLQADGNFSFYTARVNWYFPVSVNNPDDPASLFKEIEQAFIAQNWPESWKNQVLPLWRKIALWECLEYLKFVMDEHSLSLKPGEKTLNLLEALLTRFATAQIYNFIWAAGRDAAAFYMRGGVTKAHAANTVVGTIQRMAERAEAQGWEVKKFQRNYRCPQSVISQVFFNAVLKIGDDGFGTIPNELQEKT